MIALDEFVQGFGRSPLGLFASEMPWSLTSRSDSVVGELIADLGGGYLVEDDIAVHASSTIEPGAVLKGPLIIGPNCFIAAGAYLRGGCWLEQDIIIGPSCELKSSFVFSGTKLAHFNFVGDSILGRNVNCEAGSIVANYRNEWSDPHIRFKYGGRIVRTNSLKFGALAGDGTRIGANAVIAPGAILAPGTHVPRLGLVDQGLEEG